MLVGEIERAPKSRFRLRSHHFSLCVAQVERAFIVACPSPRLILCEKSLFLRRRSRETIFQ